MSSSILPKFKFPSVLSNSVETSVKSLLPDNPFGIISIYEDYEFKISNENHEEENKLATIYFDIKKNVAKISGVFIKGNDVAEHKEKYIEIYDPLHNIALYEIFRSIMQWSFDEHHAHSIIFEARMDYVPFSLMPIVLFNVSTSAIQVQEKLERIVQTVWNMKMCSN